MAKSLRLPGIEEQRVLDELGISLLLDSDAQERWNQLVVEGHYLHNATLVGEQLRYAVSCQGQWLALLGWSAGGLVPLVGGPTPPPLAFPGAKQPLLNPGGSHPVSQFGRPGAEALSGAALGRLASSARASDSGAGKFCGWPALSQHHLQGVQLDATRPDRRVWPGAEDFHVPHGRPKQLWVRALHPQGRAWLSAPELPAALQPFEKPLPARCDLTPAALDSLRARFAAVTEFRQGQGKRHRLATGLAISACAKLAGVMGGSSGIASYAENLTRPQRRALRCWLNEKTQEYEVPSEACLLCVLQGVAPLEVEAVGAGLAGRGVGPQHRSVGGHRRQNAQA
jgi:hypothetical protein